MTRPWYQHWVSRASLIVSGHDSLESDGSVCPLTFCLFFIIDIPVCSVLRPGVTLVLDSFWPSKYPIGVLGSGPLPSARSTSQALSPIATVFTTKLGWNRMLVLYCSIARMCFLSTSVVCLLESSFLRLPRDPLHFSRSAEMSHYKVAARNTIGSEFVSLISHELVCQYE